MPAPINPKHHRWDDSDVSSGQRPIVDASRYSRYFPKAEKADTVVLEDGSVDDTVHMMQRVVWTYINDTKKIAPLLQRGTLLETCNAIWNFLYNHIQYKLDEPGVEQLRRPARAWADRTTGIDCDCFSIFASSILTNLQIPHTMRITKYSQDTWQHVYVIVPKPGLGHYTIDAVLSSPNYEKPYSEKKDFPMSLDGIKIAVLSGVDDMTGDNALGALMAATEEISGTDGLLGNISMNQWHTRLLRYLEATRKAAIANPLLLEAVGEHPQDFIDMVDYAIRHWNTPMRDQALSHLAGEEARINMLNGYYDDLSGEEDLAGDDDLQGDDDMFSGLGKAKKKGKGKFFKAVKGAVKKVTHIIAKTNPLTIAIRNGILLAMKLNFRKMASRLKWGYATQQQAAAKGVSTAKWTAAKKSIAETEKFFEKLGGKKSNLQKAILKGKAGGLNGVVETEAYMGSLGEPVTAATIVTALAAIANIFRIMAKNKLAKQEETDPNYLKNGMENGDGSSDNDEGTPEPTSDGDGDGGGDAVNGILGTAGPYGDLLGHVAGMSDESLSGLSDKELDAKLYTMLVRTRTAVAANPAVIVAMNEDPTLFTRMLDYALEHWHTPMREKALHVLAENEKAINRLNGFDDSLYGDDDLSGHDDLFGALGKAGKKNGKKKKGFFNNLKQANKTKKASKLAKHNAAVAAARSGFLLAMKTDAGMIASRLKWGYADPQQAQAAGVPDSYRLKAQKALRKIEQLFAKQGGATADLKEAILSGQAGNLSGYLENDAFDLGYLGLMTGKQPKARKRKPAKAAKPHKGKVHSRPASLPVHLKPKQFKAQTAAEEKKFKERFATALQLTFSVASAALPLLHNTLSAMQHEGMIDRTEAKALKNHIVAEVTAKVAEPTPDSVNPDFSNGNSTAPSIPAFSDDIDGRPSSLPGSRITANPTVDNGGGDDGGAPSGGGHTNEDVQKTIEVVNATADGYEKVKAVQEQSAAHEDGDKAEQPAAGETKEDDNTPPAGGEPRSGIMDLIKDNPGMVVGLGITAALIAWSAFKDGKHDPHKKDKDKGISGLPDGETSLGGAPKKFILH